MDIPVGYRILILWCLSGSLAQFIKFVVPYFKHRQIDLRRLIEPGGMPSSHSASVSTLSTTIGLTFGFDSAVFAITVFFGSVIIYEATGLRRSVGEQAEVLNKLIDALYKKEKLPTERLRVVLGHTPLEVLLGVLMGIFFALAFFRN